MPCFMLHSKRIFIYADVVELVYTHALGACAVRHEGSSPSIRTFCPLYLVWLFIFYDILYVCDD